ncbi:hypothetical protein ASPSYDRAFT_49054 [Aspergillus sydowii CBS 593.65]|uniref:BZIP domain-containing protein n=1 Tax=Aspergillus sydowii CBS 593.65 TaxID=1036612 RepID=A0A1L9T6B0_9EURO|nr:uncharacterized protein ASPSYDRAFT_49054 [Aspergillus sydowii CBS 593.65]OJJ54901.1 hypothetical protein ASPSYDRAFT_49054 [Aspergillus sydowii CBS 593.65]
MNRAVSAAKEKKRAADREAQRHNRARTKAYIAYIEKTLQDLSGPNGQDSLGQQLTQQQEKINHLQETLGKIANLAQDAAGALPSSSISEKSSQHTNASQPTGEEGTPASVMNALPAGNGFFGMDLRCSDRERNYLAVLGNAVSLAQSFSPVILGDKPLTPASDDDFCIRAVVDGWKAATARSEVDVVWGLLQTVDEGLYYRTDPITRIGLLRLMRSMLLQRIGAAHRDSSLPEYMSATPVQASIMHQPFLDFFPWPQFRDYWILNGTEYVDESCAASFSTRIWFEWPFELRDVYHKQVITDTLSFSAEFESRYHDLSSWHLGSEREWPELSLETCQLGLEELQPPLTGDAINKT